MDFDDTLAHNAMVGAGAIDALSRARQAGLRLLLVTGREFPDLLTTFGRLQLFDRVVAENGALLYTPATDELRELAGPPPAPLVERLTRERVPFSRGVSIIATVRPHEQIAQAAIRDLGLDCHVIFNKGAVMVLPSGVTKASGLTAALADLGVSAAQTVAVGDAENDSAMLAMCGLNVAVGNALPALKAEAHMVTAASCGEGVTELIDWLIAAP